MLVWLRATRWPPLEKTAMADVAELRRLITGFQVTEALHVAAVLKLPDAIAEGSRS